MSGKLNENKMQAMDSNIDMLLNLIQVARDIKNGACLMTTLKEHDIDYRTFKDVMFNKHLGYTGALVPPISLEELNALTGNDSKLTIDQLKCSEYLTPEEMIYVAVFVERDIKNFPADLEETVPMALASLNDREQMVMRMRYYEGCSMEEIGHHLNVTVERIRQILSKSIRVLRHPSRASLIEYGKEYRDALFNIRSISNEHRRSEKMKLLESEANDAIRNNDRKALLDLRDKINAILEPKAYHPRYTDDMRVDVFLTEVFNGTPDTRLYNCFKRVSSIETIGDLKKKSYEDLCEIRGLGKNSLNKLIEIFKENDLDAAFLHEEV